MKGVEVTARDLETGESETKVVEVGDYMLICVYPAELVHTQASANGTHQITVKGTKNKLGGAT